MVDRRNRLRWALIALLLLAAGVAGSLISFDRIPQVDADTPLLPDTAVQRWRQAEDWRLAALTALGLLLALYGWRILAAHLRRGGGRITMGDLEFDRPSNNGHQGGGRTAVRAPALAHSIEDDLERVGSIQRALVGLFGSPHQPELRAELDVSGTADLRRVREGVTAALERLAATTSAPPRSATVTFRVVEGHTRKVQ
jgi:hypothetical protein